MTNKMTIFVTSIILFNLCFIAVEVAVNHLNEVLKRHNAIETLKALKNPDGNFPFTFQKASKYHTALLKEKEEGLPGNILVGKIGYSQMIICRK